MKVFVSTFISLSVKVHNITIDPIQLKICVNVQFYVLWGKLVLVVGATDGIKKDIEVNV